MTPDRIEEFEERAAIIEFESGEYLSRAASEMLAAEYLNLHPSDVAFLKDNGIARF